VVPTLVAGEALADCLRSLEAQEWRDFETVVVDNSGCGRAKAGPPARVIANARNLGFGAAVNQAVRQSAADYVATLNDDAVAEPQWLGRMVAAMDARPDAGMCAPCVRLSESRLDSAGMLLCADGVAKQRGHGRQPAEFARACEVLLPSGSAALYRRRMLDEIGLFDEDFFLYCEDTDLGLRARWAGWACLYVPDARVDHRHSHTAGRASPMKAYYVERNRLFVIGKNFPAPMIPPALLAAIERYFWTGLAVMRGQGVAGQYHREGGSPLRLGWTVVTAHAAALRALFPILRKRRAIRASARIAPAEFRRLARAHAIAPREVAAL